MDALQRDFSVAALEERGGWAPGSRAVARYKKPARYLRQLQLMSSEQQKLAIIASRKLEACILQGLR